MSKFKVSCCCGAVLELAETHGSYEKEFYQQHEVCLVNRSKSIASAMESGGVDLVAEPVGSGTLIRLTNDANGEVILLSWGPGCSAQTVLGIIPYTSVYPDGTGGLRLCVRETVSEIELMLGMPVVVRDADVPDADAPDDFVACEGCEQSFPLDQVHTDEDGIHVCASCAGDIAEDEAGE